MSENTPTIIHLDVNMPAIEVEGPAVVILPPGCKWFVPASTQLLRNEASRNTVNVANARERPQQAANEWVTYVEE